ncbi:hypothetical protein [Rhizobium sp. LjRoot254]|uniref:hypothetical protein n=1 Tax=Rhizobium sp. LjRoot254 TaxID=3342297 RepID=UPI003ED13039
MAATTADDVIKPQEPAKISTSKTWDIAFCLHIAAGRFGSPAGIAFLPQSYLPFLVTKKN